MSALAHYQIRGNSRLSKAVCALTVLALFGVLFAMSGEVVRGRQIVLGRAWPAMELVSMDKVEHQDWDRLLRRYVDEAGNVDYIGWRENTVDVGALDAYLDALSRAAPRLETGREARLAFWINAYNALTIRGILGDYPTAGMHDNTSRPASFNIWTDLLLHVGDSDYSLGHIEHQMLRPLHEPRIHFAIVCASRGCPRLLNRAYVSSDLEHQLHENSRNFFADPQKLAFDPLTGQLKLSPILKWYGTDFGTSQAEMLESIVPYLPDNMPRRPPGQSAWHASFGDYDWSLNDRSGKETTPPLPPPSTPPDGDEHAQDPQ